MARAMKDSGIEWIGEIPDSWGFARIGSLYTLRNTKVSDTDYPPLSVTNKGIVPQLETAAKTNAHDDRKLVKQGDFAINSRSDRRGSCGISRCDGSVSLINTILAPNSEMNPQYYDWLFHTVQFADEFYKWGHGIVDDLWTTGWQDMKRIIIPLPSLEEQEIIASFLDVECAEIDALMADVQAQIATLEQYKRSVITEAVTKGLNPNVPMKDSGTDWMGMVPRKWVRTRIKYCLCEIDLRSITGKEEPLSMSQRFGIIPTSQIDVPHSLASYVGAKIAHPGDLVFNKLKAHLGVFSVSQYTGLVSPDYAVYRAYEKVNAKYLEYLFKTDACIAEFKKRITGVGQGLSRLYTSDLFAICVAIPQKVEQDTIVKKLDAKCAEIDAIIEGKRQQLSTLEEYKKSIIFEYVTGKKEVPVA